MTSLPADLLGMLVCPKCKGQLVAEPASLRCDACRLRYRVDDGIPVMLIDEAQPLGGDTPPDPAAPTGASAPGA